MALLVRVLPLLADEEDFALKGGTAIDLIATRTALALEIVAGMPPAHREFLAGFKRGAPDWDLTGVPQIRDLPAVRWKQENLDRMTPSQRGRAVERLEAVLGLAHR